ncbi:MAG TPA: hypothetical protein VFA39_15740 [Steroidobacteraceae bacterium]|nr:hypothetical protein [Steroidobacteraceae bacterium]
MKENGLLDRYCTFVFETLLPVFGACLILGLVCTIVLIIGGAVVSAAVSLLR